ncbi:MAG: MBL fold metallo-hydrolase [Deltaproteobacteria bacterium]|nr:MBL fold metallo-hydrolase [Deltaproteobacteria bacterium]MBW2018732.1 MBL fold metallo-hydrolase [Deltaproteobacteria bacterium]MBW2073461.1 MBL fold metallo-hydrolase [Deltaproteobacteria bacterium]RLB83034.1 MAG: MBL fold metallo-hydrolase [Deltaproteobacteria bacterium]
MPKLIFLGATGTVTGSRFVLETQGKKLLIDCGLFQGLKQNRLKNWDPFPISPAEIDRVFLTHAHIDHTGYLPRFCKHGFVGKIHCTYATRDLCEIMLRDSGHLQEEDACWANKKGFSKHRPALPLYTVKDAEKALSYFEPVYYGEDLFVTDKLRVKFKDAGHILGSSFVDVKTMWGNKTRKIVFSGDVGRPGRPILRDPIQVFEVDYLILESTYGNRLHDNSSAEEELARVINESVARGGVLVIPAFAVGRTQELLFSIRELEEQEKIPSLPVYVDSPMAIDVTAVFERSKADYDLRARILELNGKRILQPKQIRFCKTRDQSQAINEEKSRAIIISASGMVTGGRILHHLAYRLPNPNDTVLFIGYQGEGTRGRTILEGNPSVKIHGQQIPICAKIESISGFSAHADYNEILAWLVGFNRPPLKTFIVHGEPEASATLAEKIQKMLGWDVVIPEFNESFELD